MIEFVKILANTHKRKHPFNSEELDSVALASLVEVLAEYPADRVNLRGILASTVRRNILDFIAEDRVIKISHTTFRKLCSEGKLKTPIHLVAEMNQEKVSKAKEESDINLILEDLNLSDEHEQIIRAVLSGKNDRQIASEFNYQPSWIGKIRQTVGRKLIRLMNNDSRNYNHLLRKKK